MSNRMFAVLAVLIGMAGMAAGQGTDPGVRDTVYVGAVSTNAGQKAIVPVSLFNDEDLGAITIPLRWSSPAISLDSVSFVGTRISYVNVKPITIDNGNQRVVFGAIIFTEAFLGSGNGVVAKLHFNIPPGTPDQFVSIDSTTIDPAGLLLTKSDASSFVPEFKKARITIGNPPDPGHITLSADSLAFEGQLGFPDPLNQTLSITNTGGGTMVWTASRASTWLSISPSSGTAPSVTSIHAASSTLPEGVYYDTIVVSAATADNTPRRLPVKLRVVRAAPTIRFGPSQFAISGVQGGANPPDRKLAIWTDIPGSLLNWTVTRSSSWLTLTPTSGTPPDSVTLQVDITGLSFGIYYDTIVIADPTAVNNPQKVPVTLQIVSNLPVIAATPNPLHVIVQSGVNAADRNVTIFNAGEGSMTFTATENSSRITGINPSSGSAPQNITLSFKTLPVSDGDYWDTVVVTSPEAINSPYYLVVHFHISVNPAKFLITPASFAFNYYECWQGPDPTLQIKNVQILNLGSDVLPWGLSFTAPWLVASTDTGYAPTLVTFSLKADGLPVGTYYDTVVVHSDLAINTPRRVPVVLNVVPGSLPPELLVNGMKTAIPAQEVFGMTIDKIAAVCEVMNAYPGCMNYGIQESIPWLRFLDTAGAAPAIPRATVEVGSYTYGKYYDTLLVTSPTATNSPVKVGVELIVWRMHGDANWDNKINIGDAVHIVNWLFKGGPPPYPELFVGDCNCDWLVNIGDAIYIVNYLFKGGDAPCGNP